jgi:uncharacterized protein (DUF2342 family)
MTNADAAIKSAVDSKNSPRWAQSCPKSFRQMQEAMAKAGALMGALRMDDRTRRNLGEIISHVAATCWAAGAASVIESRGETTKLDG